MSNATYSEKLQNPLWQRKRLEILNRDNFTCQLCQDKGTTLHIHHKEYIKGNQPWEYADDNFQTLCKYCHAVVEHFKRNDKDDIVLFCKKINYETDYSCADVIIQGLEFVGIFMISVYLNDCVVTEGEAIRKYDVEKFTEVFDQAIAFLNR